MKMFKDNHQKIAKVMVTFVVEVDVKNKGYLAESVTSGGSQKNSQFCKTHRNTPVQKSFLRL